MALPKSLQRFADKIQEVSDERRDGDGFWVYLMPGWISPFETHCVHEDTIAACAKQMKEIEKCTCKMCLEAS